MADENPVKPAVPETEQPVTCTVCRRELPAGRAVSKEVADYVLWFCGQECYGQWRREREGNSPPQEQS